MKKYPIFHWLRKCLGILGVIILVTAPSPSHAEEPQPVESKASEDSGTLMEKYSELVNSYGEEFAPAFPYFTVSNLWILLASALVFTMHLGFCCLESGLTQAKNTTNILFKNIFIICMGVTSYLLYGFNAMYPGEFNGFFALGSPVTMQASGDQKFDYAFPTGTYTGWTDFIFQAMFAATAASIISGAVAERVKLISFLLGATLLVTFGYTTSGAWQWGGGWLSQMGFKDFAGSSIVHAFGGFAALGAVLLLGPRAGKYLPDGKIKPILGHSMPLATIGGFLLFFGWFGFNGGSVLSADPESVAYVFVTTTVAGFTGGLEAMFTSWIILKKPDLTMAINGMLAGLVAICAGADTFPLYSVLIVGVVAGLLVVLSVIFLDKIKIDDPVGAISVHGTCGIWGTLAIGLPFLNGGAEGISFLTQLLGALAVAVFALVFALVVFGLIKATLGLRVSPDEEEEGLDWAEHGQESYHGLPTGQAN